MGYFCSEFGTLLYGACAWLNVQCLAAEIANVIYGHSGSSSLFIRPRAVISQATSLWSGALVLCGNDLLYIVAHVLHLVL